MASCRLALCAAAVLLMTLVTSEAYAVPCTPDPGFEFCEEFPNQATAAPKIQIDVDYNTAIANGNLVALSQYVMRFKCNGVLFYNSTLPTCGVGGCAGENLGTGTIQKVIDTAYTENSEMQSVVCYVQEGNNWSAQAINPWKSGVHVVHCYTDAHCPSCGDYCYLAGLPSTWQCEPRLELCNGLDDDCNPATPDGASESWFGDPCDGPDSDKCLEGIQGCVGAVQQCTDATGNDLDLCDGNDNDCDPNTPDGSDEPWYDTKCDGPDADLCKEGLSTCSGAIQTCTDVSGDSADTCNGLDDDCNPATPDGASESWFGDPCDGADTDKCLEGSLDCIGAVQQCNDTTGNDLDLCDGNDNDCDPNTPDGSGEAWYGAQCDGPDSDQCKEGLSECSAAKQICTDSSGDDVEVCDGLDNDCNGVPDDIDFDKDKIFDCVDPDDDNDGVPDGSDPSPLDPDVCGDSDNDTCDDCSVGSDDLGPLVDSLPTNDGTDTNGDGFCDAGDTDGDNIPDAVEGTDDKDGDGIPNNEDPDSDGDGISDSEEGGDQDAFTPPVDTDGDGSPDYLDEDSDNDGILDGVDNCRLVSNPDQKDSDGNGEGDLCDNDKDGDGVLNEDDNCPGVHNPDQEDLDGDGVGDVCDGDIDGDTIPNDVDTFELDPDRCGDIDNDGCDDCAVEGVSNPLNDGPDSDGDGICDDDEVVDDVPDGPGAQNSQAASSCSCRMIGQGPASGALWAFLLAGLVGALRRRRSSK